MGSPLRAEGVLSTIAEAAPPMQRMSVTWRRYVYAVLQRKWLVLLIGVMGAAAGLVGTRFVRPEYLAQSILWIEVSSAAASSRGPIRSDELLHSYAWVELMKAYTVLDHVVTAQRLYLTAASMEGEAALAGFGLQDPFRPGSYRLRVDDAGETFVLESAEQEAVLDRGAVGEPVGEELGFDWVPPAGTLPAGALLEFSVAHPRDVARLLAERLDTQMAENGNFLRLELRGHEPERIAATLNAVAERYVEVAAELKSAKLTELAKILDEQLRYAEGKLHESELALESFRVQTITLPSDAGTPVASGLEATRDPVFANFFNLKIEREQLRRDREAILRALSQARDSSLTVEGLEAIPSVQGSSELVLALKDLTQKRAELRSLESQFTETYPPLRRLRDEVRRLEQATVPALAQALTRDLLTRETELDRLVNSTSTDLRQIPLRANEEARLRRDVIVAENLYTTLQQRYEEARLAAVSSVPDVRILDRAAVPQRPVIDQRLRLLLMAALGGLGVGILAALLLDRVDRRLRYPEEITYGLGLPILGVVADVAGANGNRPHDATNQIMESFREIRLALSHEFESGRPFLVTITSPASGDGKSFTTANLALAFGDTGQRTLVIDGDTRRGSQHKLLGTSRKPGLTDLLSETASLEEVIRPTRQESVDLIPYGTRMQLAPELLSSEAMRSLLETVRHRYAVVLVDSPPLGAGVDPFILGTLTGATLLVLRAGVTDRELAETKLQLLDRLPVRILGVVLNAVEPRGAYSYYSYISGYETTDEESQQVAGERVLSRQAH